MSTQSPAQAPSSDSEPKWRQAVPLPRAADCDAVSDEIRYIETLMAGGRQNLDQMRFRIDLCYGELTRLRQLDAEEEDRLLAEANKEWCAATLGGILEAEEDEEWCAATLGGILDSEERRKRKEDGWCAATLGGILAESDS